MEKVLYYYEKMKFSLNDVKKQKLTDRNKIQSRKTVILYII